MMPAVKQPSSPDLRPMPVFYDSTGKRMSNVLVSLMVLGICLTVSLIIILPYALEPLWKAAANGSNNFPRQFLAQANTADLPVIGDDKFGIFNRIVKINHIGDNTLLIDPFTDQIYRSATEEERQQIGESPYALDNFGRPADHTLVLTFDDGPDAVYTPELLDLLSKEQVPVTFFTIGKAIVKSQEVFKRIIREGHMVGNHTMNHTDFDTHMDTWNREELIATDRIMRATGGYSSRLFRIPRGDPDNSALAVL